MAVTISLPDEILGSESADLPRRVLEQVALEGFKSGQLTIVRRGGYLVLKRECRYMIFWVLTAIPGLIIRSKRLRANEGCSKERYRDALHLRHITSQLFGVDWQAGHTAIAV